jgi:hypothetical protein
MSQVALSGNALGTGTFTIASPNSNTNRTLNLPDASGTILTDSGGQAASFSALTVNGNNISAVNSLGFRNRIINGDMRIDQRNGGASVTPLDGQYTLDRWAGFRSQASKFSVQVNAGSVTPPAGFTNYAGVVSLSAYSSLSGDYFGFQQSIEGFNSADLGFGTAAAQAVTLSFWVRSSLTGTLGGALRNSGNTRNFCFSYSVAAANTWEFKTITIPGDTTGTWLTNNNLGIQVWFDLGSGSSLTGATGSWSATQIIRPTGSVSLVGTNGATFYITGVQFEAGSVATPFERRDYGRELMMCQRYYETRGFFFTGYGPASGTVDVDVPWTVLKRASPTFNYGAIGYSNSSGATTVAVDIDRVVIRYVVTVLGPATINTSWTASAEL